MPSDLFQSFGNQQNPREQAMALMKQQGITVPENIANNPQAIIQHLMQSGRVPQGRLNMAQQIMQRMFHR